MRFTPTLVLAAISTGICCAASSRLERAAASKPVAPIRMGTPAAAQAVACAATPAPTLKSTATAAPCNPSAASAVISTPQGEPSRAASCPSRALLGEAIAPLSRRGGVWRARSSTCPMRPVMPKIARPCTRGLVDGARKELLHALEKRALAGLMAALLQRGLELAQQLLL